MHERHLVQIGCLKSVDRQYVSVKWSYPWGVSAPKRRIFAAMVKKITTWVLHILVWALFFSLPFLLQPDRRDANEPPSPETQQMEPGAEAPQPSVATARHLFRPGNAAQLPGMRPSLNKIMLLTALLLVAFFYFNQYYLLPKIWKIHGVAAWFATIILTAIIVVGIPVFLREQLIADLRQSAQGFRSPPFLGFGFLVNCVLFLLVAAVSSGFWLAREYRKSAQLIIESENARLDAELAQLKAQINPHFLFNTLNGIYALTLEKSDAAPDALLRLSSLLRYLLGASSADLVLIKDDLEHLKAFVELHQIRLPEKSSVSFVVDGVASKDKKMAPMLLLPFVENAFKYGVSAQETAHIDIRISLNTNTLEFFCENKIVRQKTTKDEVSGIGIKNTRRRLDMIYPNQHELRMEEKDGRFEVNLKINI